MKNKTGAKLEKAGKIQNLIELNFLNKRKKSKLSVL